MPYTDYSGFDQSYFEGRNVATPNDAGYSEYQPNLLPFGHYAKFVRDRLQERGFDPSKVSILVVGCAYGYTVEQLDALGISAYGMDVSSWAVGQAPAGVTVVQGDVLNSADLQNARQGGKPDIVYNECVIECLTDSEAVRACDNMRAEAKHLVIHRVWSTDGSDLNPDYYNAKTLAEWQSLCDPDSVDYWYSEKEFQPTGDA